MALTLAACSGSAQGPTNEKAPDTFRVNFDTSRGPFVVEIIRDQGPQRGRSFL